MNKQILVGLTVDAMISNLSHKSFNFEDQIKKEALFFVNNPSINLILTKKKKKNPSINLFGAESYSRVSFHSH